MTSDRITGVLLALLGLAVGLEATTFTVAFLVDPVGPKALPMVTAAMLLGSGTYLAWRPGDDAPWPHRTILLRLGKATVALGLYGLLLQPFGFVVATVLVVTALSVLFGGTVKHSVTAAILLSTGLWYLFVWALGLPLPLGDVWLGILEMVWMP